MEQLLADSCCIDLVAQEEVLNLSKLFWKKAGDSHANCAWQCCDYLSTCLSSVFYGLNHFHNLRRIPAEKTSHWIQNKYISLPQGVKKQSIEPKLCKGSEPVSKPVWLLFCTHHHLYWEQIYLLFNPLLMRENVPYFAQ